MLILSVIRQKATFPKIALFLLVILLTGNLSAIVDALFHPEIPYFDIEHWIIGSTYNLLVCILFISYEISNVNQKKLEREKNQLNKDLERKIMERTNELANAYESLKIEVGVRKQAEEYLQNALIAAESANRVKSDFLANMSHELTTPLNSVIGFSQVLKDGLSGELNTDQQEYVDNVLQGGMRLLSLIRSMLDLTKADSGKDELIVKRFLLKETLKSSLAMFNEKSIERNLKLTLQIEPDADIVIETDAGKLTRILHNLIDNAVKFTPDGGSVFVKARKMRDTKSVIPACPESIPNLLLSDSGQAGMTAKRYSSIEISISDTGIGIAPENIDKLFQPFTQLESPYTKKYSGTGIACVEGV